MLPDNQHNRLLNTIISRYNITEQNKCYFKRVQSQHWYIQHITHVIQAVERKEKKAVISQFGESK